MNFKFLFCAFLLAIHISNAQNCTVDLGPDLIPCSEGWLSGHYETTVLAEGASFTGVQPATFLWQKAGNFPGAISDFLSEPDAAHPVYNSNFTYPGVFQFSLRVTYADGCVATDTISVTFIDVVCMLGGFPVTIQKGDTTTLIPNCMILPESLDVTYNWQPSATIKDNSIKNPLAFPSVSTYYTYSIAYGNGCFDATTDGCQVNVGPLGIAASPEEDSFLLYPNPVNESLFLRYSGMPNTARLEMTDATGRIVLLQTIEKTDQRISLTSLSEGIYYCRIISDEKTTEVKKILKVRN